MAFRLFFSALAERPAGPLSGGPLVATGQQAAMLSAVHLQPADQDKLLTSLLTFRKDIHRILNAKDSSAPTIDQFTEELVTSLKIAMTRDGFDRLLQQVRSEKRNMKRVALPNMSSAQ